MDIYPTLSFFCVKFFSNIGSHELFTQSLHECEIFVLKCEEDLERQPILELFDVILYINVKHLKRPVLEAIRMSVQVLYGLS